MKLLADNDLDRLFSAVIAEQNRRGKKVAVSYEGSRKRQVKSLDVPLTQGKLNAVRAAFKAGVKPVPNRSTVWNFAIGCTQGVDSYCDKEIIF
jgi:hypothetical protein